MKAITNTMNRIDSINEVTTFWTLLGILLCIIATYGYFLNATVSSVIERERAAHEQEELLAELTYLETEHVALRSEVTMDLAYKRNFVDAAEPTFIALTSANTALSMSAE